MSGQCLSPDVAGRPLSPATRRRLGGPLPHQLADRARAHPKATFLRMSFSTDLKIRGLIWYYLHFREAIPVFGVDYSRVPNPFAAIKIQLLQPYGHSS